ncbi:TetR/AcrR family transcriptional regulator [Leptospira idonii]|uniref:TetR/AcrR family transcriptional regulator n=1 Tax=Leptospira idonii TaxID=1193500 RepID=A0A4R9LZT3_9LEPT|nr:TetR/AcrR family transcriptional regulator [Leptospira idonii]TGN19890.1 TetR/AcrR family transcriptional regulator [Leptospira idonii]
MSVSSDQTKAKILNRAVALASTVGLEGITIGVLAEDLGMSKSGLFGRFHSKETLQIEVLRAGSEIFRRRVLYPALKAKPGTKRLNAVFQNWLDWAASDELPGGCLFLATNSEYDDRPGIVRDFLVQLQTDWMRTLHKFLQEAKSLNEISTKTNSDQFLQELWGIIFGFQFYNRLLQDEKAKTRAKTAFDQLMQRYTT